jgi:hypothetical protein
VSDAGRDGLGADWRRAPTAADRVALARDPSVATGLCGECLHLRLLRTGRSRFVRCQLAESDPGYPRYPLLPVLDCKGCEPWRES